MMSGRSCAGQRRFTTGEDSDLPLSNPTALGYSPKCYLNLSGFMRARSLFSCLILLLFTSSWVGLLAAACCPHMAADHSCCRAMSRHSQMPRDAMGDMGDMGGMGVGPVAEIDEGAAPFLRAGGEVCSHCITHSELPIVILREATHGQRDAKVTAPAISDPAALRSPFLPASAISSRSHAPPGATAGPRVLINILRI